MKTVHIVLYVIVNVIVTVNDVNNILWDFWDPIDENDNTTQQ
jgi:hypothetical protein